MAPSTKANTLVFQGTLVHTPVYGQVEFLHDHLLVVQGGCITKIAPSAEASTVLFELGLSSSEVRTLNVRELSLACFNLLPGVVSKFDRVAASLAQAGQFLTPGFIDTHCHAPQYKFSGTGTDVPLLDWLKKYTFPVESSYKDVHAAQQRYNLLVKRLLANGTTTATYYGSLDLEPNKVLVDSIQELGQRAVVGKVNMDRESPEDYVETTEQGLQDAEEFVQYTLSKKCSRIYPCITPRFIPTCTPKLMQGLAALARKYNIHIQSHISECCGEVNFSRSLHPEYASDTAVFEEMGLLTNKTVMAHGTLLSDEDLKHLAVRGTSVAHCPLSNFFLGDACFRVNHALSLGVKVGLGTDVAGGISPSMLTAQRMAVVNSRCLRAHKLANSGGTTVTPEMEVDVISFKEALWLATMGGAQALDLQDVIGSFAVGKEFDALLIDVSVLGGPFDVFEDETLEEQFEKFINLGDDRNILEVFVQGQCVKATARQAPAGTAASPDMSLNDSIQVNNCEEKEPSGKRARVA